MHTNVRLSCGFSIKPPSFSPAASLMLSIASRHQWGQLFPAVPITWAQFRWVSSWSCVHMCMLVAKHEGERQTERGDGESFQEEVTSRSKFPHAQLPVLSVCGRPLSWAGCPLSISQSLWLIAWLSGHVGNSVEAVLNNNTIILAMGEGRHRSELFVPGIPLQYPAECTLCLI